MKKTYNLGQSADKLARLKKVNHILTGSLMKCEICPRRCRVDREKGERGYCRAPFNPAIYSYLAHHGEEPPISGSKGSGTIFFSFCNMRCAYCQNYNFSQLDAGQEVSIEKLAGTMLHLQNIGCHNINLVSPTHFIPQILLALEIAINGGLNIPIVYNTGGYELPKIVSLLDGIVDVYLPDMRYSDDSMAKKYSDAPSYTLYNMESVIEMHRQAGDLVMNDRGIAQKGLIIRLLSLPENISGTNKSLNFIKDRISPNTYLSIMSQYYPTFKAYNYKELSRGVTPAEYKNTVDEAAVLGLNNGWIQESPGDMDDKFMGTNIQPKD